MKTIIAVPDFTRKAHLKKTLPPAIKKLHNEGFSNKDIEILIATGLHHPPSEKELRKNMGSIVDKMEPTWQGSCGRNTERPKGRECIKISSHDYREGSSIYFGKTKSGVPIYLNKKLKQIGSIITIGVVEPHLYAGYSGGTKVAAIGLAGEDTINYTHHPRFLDREGTRICSIDKNPFRNFIYEVDTLLPIRYSINIVNDGNGRLLKIFKGHPRTSFKKAVVYAKKLFEKKINKSFDCVICGIPKEKGVNIYQASRAFNYVANTKNCVLKKNGIIIVTAGLEEGFGKGLGEQRFQKKMSEMKTPEKLISEIKKGGCLAGEHRAYMVAKALTHARLGFITKKANLYKNKGLPFLFFNTIEDAQTFIKNRFGSKCHIYYLKNAFTTILTHSIRTRG